MTEQYASAPALEVGQPFNPFGLFTGIFVPDALVRSTAISAGAKLTYGRLARYSGQGESAIPRCTRWLRKSACRSGRHKTTWRSWRPRNSSGRVRRFAGRAQTSNAYQFLWHRLLEEGVKKAAPEGVSAERYRATLTVHARCKVPSSR